MIIVAGCDFIGGVFQTGIGVGVFITIAVLILIFLSRESEEGEHVIASAEDQKIPFSEVLNLSHIVCQKHLPEFRARLLYN